MPRETAESRWIGSAAGRHFPVASGYLNSVKVLARGLNNVTAIIVGRKRYGFSCAAINPMSKGAVITNRLGLIKRQNSQHPLRRFFAPDESTLSPNHDGKKAKAGAAGGAHIWISIAAFANQTRLRMREVPKIAEGRLLHRSHERFVILRAALGTDRSQGIGFRPITLDCHHLVPALLVVGANEIAVQSMSHRLGRQSLKLTVSLLSAINVVTRHQH